MEASCPLEQHNVEIGENRRSWERKPVLRRIYEDFHRQILASLRLDLRGATVELGSGLGQIKNVIPDCITTDILPNRWLDQTENAYQLSFTDKTVANLILFDVLHHLRFPGTALLEFRRVLIPGGRVIIFEPCMSVFGLLVYGFCHHESLGLRKPITWLAPENYTIADVDYYAAASNAWRIFCGPSREKLNGWRTLQIRRSAAFSYVASGGFRSCQLYPSSLLPILQRLDTVLDYLPVLFATRLLVVLEKEPSI